MVAEYTGTNPDGKSFDNTATYTRVSGAKGLMGSWKDTDVKLKEEFTMSMKAGASADTIRWELPTIKAYVDLSLDGKECAPTGPTVPKGLTLTATKTGPRSLTVVEKLNGKLLERNTYKVSADGKTLTEISTPADGKAPETIIFDKISA